MVPVNLPTHDVLQMVKGCLLIKTRVVIKLPSPEAFKHLKTGRTLLHSLQQQLKQLSHKLVV